MKAIAKTVGALALAAVLLTGCSATAGEPEPTPTRTPVSGTITMPEGPTGGAATPTATPSPVPDGTATPMPFPMKGVNAQGVERDQSAEAAFLNRIGYGPDPVLDADGKSLMVVVGELEDFEPTDDFFLNIIYAGCAASLDEAATPPVEMLQRVVNLTAEQLRHATGDDIMVQGYIPIISAGTALICGDRFPPLPAA